MEKFAIALANKIATELQMEDEKREVIAYGLIAIIQMIITTMLVFIAGLIAGTAVEALIICFSVSLLRKYSGGAHLGTIEICTSFALVYCIGFSLIAKYLIYPVLNTYILTFVSFAVLALAYFTVYKLAPVDTPNKPIKTDKKKKRMRRGSFTTLTVYLGISVVLLSFSAIYPFLLSYQTSLLFGILWQIFTLTKIGSFILGRIDLISRKILYLRKEAN